MARLHLESIHWFRQASEMDPRKKGEEGRAAVEAGQLSKPGSGGGGELSGELLFPKDSTRIVLSAHPNFSESEYGEELLDKYPELVNFQPSLLYPVRKEGASLQYRKMPVPNLDHWRIELYLDHRKVLLRNYVTDADRERRIDPITEQDPLGVLLEDAGDGKMSLKLGGKASELGVQIIKPNVKGNTTVTLGNMIKHRIPRITNDDLKRVKQVMEQHLSDTKVKVDIFSNNNKVASCTSNPVKHQKKSGPRGRQNQATIYHIPSRMSCSEGGANIVLCCDRNIESDANPRLQLWSRDILGEEVREKELEDQLLNQPDPKQGRRGNDHLIFISPSLDVNNLERIKDDNLEIRLSLEREADKTKKAAGILGEEFVYELHNSKKVDEDCFWCQKSNRELIPSSEIRRKHGNAARFEKQAQDETEEEDDESESWNPGQSLRKKLRVASHDSGLGTAPPDDDQPSVENLDMIPPEKLWTYKNPMGVEDMSRYLKDMDTDEYGYGQIVAQGPLPRDTMSSDPAGSRPTYEAQAGPLVGVPRSSKPRGPRPNCNRKRAKVVRLYPSSALARSPELYPNEHQKSVTLRKTLLSCIFYLANEFCEVLLI